VVREAKKKRLNLSKSRQDAISRRFGGKHDAVDLPVVKFKVEKLPMPTLPLGNRACCCRIGR